MQVGRSPISPGPVIRMQITGIKKKQLCKVMQNVLSGELTSKRQTSGDEDAKKKGQQERRW
jgi:hypothetical protein